MQLIRFTTPSSPDPQIGLLAGTRITVLAGTIADLLTLSLDDFRATLEQVGDAGTLDPDDITLLPPIDGLTEVWAAGVTYLKSREARVEESANSADVYERVYGAARPELFFKSVAWRTVGHDQSVAIRSDSSVDVPEPELALILNSRGQILGYTVCNDVSSRSIEGENPLYLPQAKVYLGSCAIGPGIRPAWEVSDPYNLEITLTIERSGTQIWHGAASTSQLHRRFDELVDYLGHAEHFPHGAVLSTGTCLVPDLPFTLQEQDRITIDIAEIGTLQNTVVQGKEAMSWLRPESSRP